MGIIPVTAKSKAKDYMFPKLLINETIEVKKITGSVATSDNPHYESTEEITLSAPYTNFLCSIFNIMSGKINSVFGERGMEELVAEFGILTNELYILQYVSGVELAPGVLNNLAIGEQVLIELDGCESGDCDNWWRVRKVIQDSEGLLHTAIVTK